MSNKGNRFENNHNRNLGYSKRKFENQLNEMPTIPQMEYYNDLLQRCSKSGVNISFKKPTTRKEYSDAIEYLDTLLKENIQKSISEPKKKLIFLFDKMTPAQKTRFLAYGEGLLAKTPSEKTADKANPRKFS